MNVNPAHWLSIKCIETAQQIIEMLATAAQTDLMRRT